MNWSQEYKKNGSKNARASNLKKILLQRNCSSKKQVSTPNLEKLFALGSATSSTIRNMIDYNTGLNPTRKPTNMIPYGPFGNCWKRKTGFFVHIMVRNLISPIYAGGC